MNTKAYINSLIFKLNLAFEKLSLKKDFNKLKVLNLSFIVNEELIIKFVIDIFLLILSISFATLVPCTCACVAGTKP